MTPTEVYLFWCALAVIGITLAILSGVVIAQASEIAALGKTMADFSRGCRRNDQLAFAKAVSAMRSDKPLRRPNRTKPIEAKGM